MRLKRLRHGGPSQKQTIHCKNRLVVSDAFIFNNFFLLKQRKIWLFQPFFVVFTKYENASETTNSKLVILTKNFCCVQSFKSPELTTH